jgi:hypothetical protein
MPGIKPLPAYGKYELILVEIVTGFGTCSWLSVGVVSTDIRAPCEWVGERPVSEIFLIGAPA